MERKDCFFMKPIIGIPSDQLVEVNPRMPGDYLAYAPHDTKEAIYATHGIPIILPFPDRKADATAAAKEMVDLYDGLLLPGGPDVDPLYFSEQPHPQIGITLSAKDEFEIALIKETIKQQKPIFGICRGLQILNVALGGSLYQDLPSQYENLQVQHSQATLGHFPTHDAFVTPETKLAQMFAQKVTVNSRHHQAIKSLGEGLIASAKAYDGVIEAIESKQANALAVQWHPENLWQEDPAQLQFFSDLVKRAQEWKLAHTKGE